MAQASGGATLSMEFRSVVRIGGTLCVHRNSTGHIVAYSVADKIMFVRRPLTDVVIREFVSDFNDLGRFSLDSLRFKWVLARALCGAGIRPTLSAVKNMQMYNAYFHSR